MVSYSFIFGKKQKFKSDDNDQLVLNLLSISKVKHNTISATKAFWHPSSVKAHCHRREFAVVGESVDVGHHHMVTILSNACKQRLGPVALRAAVANPSENDGDIG